MKASQKVKRIVSFLIAVLLIFTAVDWIGLSTVAFADEVETAADTAEETVGETAVESSAEEVQIVAESTETSIEETTEAEVQETETEAPKRAASLKNAPLRASGSTIDVYYYNGYFTYTDSLDVIFNQGWGDEYPIVGSATPETSMGSGWFHVSVSTSINYKSGYAYFQFKEMDGENVLAQSANCQIGTNDLSAYYFVDDQGKGHNIDTYQNASGATAQVAEMQKGIYYYNPLFADESELKLYYNINWGGDPWVDSTITLTPNANLGSGWFSTSNTISDLSGFLAEGGNRSFIQFKCASDLDKKSDSFIIATAMNEVYCVEDQPYQTGTYTNVTPVTDRAEAIALAKVAAVAPMLYFHYYNPNIPYVVVSGESGTTDPKVYLHYKVDGGDWQTVQVDNKSGANDGWYYGSITKPEGSQITYYYSRLDKARGQETDKGLWWSTVTLDAANELKNTWRSDDFVINIADGDVIYSMDQMAMGDDLADDGRAVTTASGKVVYSAAEARNAFYPSNGNTDIYVYSSRNIAYQYVGDGIWGQDDEELDFYEDSAVTVSSENGLRKITVPGINAKEKNLVMGFGVNSDDTGVLLINKNPAYVNADTGVVYSSEAELRENLTSTLTIESDQIINSVTITYGSNLINGDLQAVTKTISNPQKTGNAYVIEVPVDAEHTYYDPSNKEETKGYKLDFKYGGTPFLWGLVLIGDRNGNMYIPDGLSRNNMSLEITDGVARVTNRVIAHYKNSNGWSSVSADIYAGGLKDANKIFANLQACTNEGDGWWSIDTGLNPEDYPDGIYVIFKGTRSSQQSKAYQFENSARVWVLPNMTMFRSQEDAEASLVDDGNDNAVNADKVRVWFYHPGGWKAYYVGYPGAAGYDYTGLTASKEYPGWYSAEIDNTVTEIYFDEDRNSDNGGNRSDVYDISSNILDTIFAVADTSVLQDGWSVTSAQIVQAYNLLASPESKALTLPVTVYDYQADNLFFEYDQTYLKNMTMVKGTEFNLYNQIGTTLIGRDKQVDWEGRTAGDEPTYDRNMELYSKGLLMPELNNGTLTYTQQAVEYVANAVYRGIQFNHANPTVADYNRAPLYDTLDAQIWNNGNMQMGTYTESEAKHITSYSQITTAMDYAYYIMSNLFKSGESAKDYGMYQNLILQRTGKNIYGFYANYQTDKDTGEGLVQNHTIIYDPYRYDASGNRTGTGSIRNDANSKEWVYTGETNDHKITNKNDPSEEYTSFGGYAGFFPLHKELMDRSFGAGDSVGSDVGQSGKTNSYYYYNYGIPSLEGTTKVEFTNNEFLHQWYRDDEHEGDATYWDTDLVAATAYTEGAGDNYRFDSVDYNNRNYHYGLRSSGKFRYVRDNDLYFTFTGDDDVFLFIDGQLVMELGAAHAAASYTVYLNDLVDFKGFNMVDGQYYDFDFFYMERHTEWANIRIETNIDVIDVSGRVVKKCYYDNDAEHGNDLIPSGNTVGKDTPVTYSFELTAGEDEGLTNLAFDDDSLGIHISADGTIDLGSYPNPADPAQSIPRNINELTVTIDGAQQSFGTPEELQAILMTGINPGSTIVISGIKWTMDETTSGPVVATMHNGNADVDLTSSCGYTVYVDEPAIKVTKSAYDLESGNKLPDGSVLHTGEQAGYILTLSNTGTSAVTDLQLVDDDLEVGFYADKQSGHYFKLNDYTEVEDLIINVNGADLENGSFHVEKDEETGKYVVSSLGISEDTPEAALDALLEKVMNQVYPTDGGITISGIQYPVNEPVFPSTVVGQAHNVDQYSLLSDDGINNGANHLEEYAQAYKKATEDGTALPTFDEYFSNANYKKEGIDNSTKQNIEKYIVDYAKYVAGESDTLPDISTYTAFEVDNTPLEDDATVVVGSQNNQHVYFSEAGNPITPQLAEIIHKPVEDGKAVLSDVTLGEGYHTITVLGENVRINDVVIKDSEGQPVENAKATVVESGNGYVTVSFLIDSDNDGQYDEGVTPDTYTIEINGRNGRVENGLDIVVDNQPEDYKIVAKTTVGGKDVYTELTPNANGEYVLVQEDGTEVVVASIDNSNVYPIVTYVSEQVGDYTFYVLPVSAAVDSGVAADQVTVHTYKVNDDVYVLDYGLTVDLSKEDATFNNNGMFANDTGMTIDGVSTTKEYFGLKNGLGTEATRLSKLAAVAVDASTEESDAYVATKATDGDAATRWASEEADEQWLRMDLGAAYTVSSVKLAWEAAYASQYQIQVSTDNENWKTVYSNYEANGGTVTISFAPVAAQYVKLYCIKRGTEYGFSVYEFEVYGTGSVYAADGFANELTTTAEQMTYGDVVSAEGTGNYANAKVTYTLNKFLEGIDTFYYGVQVSAEGAAEKNVTTATPVMYAKVQVMPATIVYYEDNFAAVVSNATNKQEGKTNSTQGNSLETQYGYDPFYAGETYGNSNGSYTALAGNESLVFTFTGTGFDIMTRTTNANLYVAVYDARYYTKSSYQYSNNTKTMYYATKRTDVDVPDTVNGPIKTAYINAYNENQTIEQIPLVSMKMDAPGTYLVVATKRSGSEKLYVDGIRIYDPLGARAALKDNKTVADAYSNATGEMNATVQDVRSMILGTGYTFSMGSAADPAVVTAGQNIIAGLAQFDAAANKLYMTQGSTVVECYTGSVDSGVIVEDDKADAADHTSSLLAYAISGPNNELYLTGEDYVFATTISPVASVADADRTVQIGLKVVEGSVTVQYRTTSGWANLTGENDITSATEQYYKVPLDTLWTVNERKVLMLRAVSAVTDQAYILSLTNIKSYGVTFKKPDTNDLGGVVVESQASAGVYEVMSSSRGTKKNVLTFSAPEAVTDFALAPADDSGNAAGDPVFTFTDAKGVKDGSTSGVKVSYRTADGKKIYIVNLPGSVPAGKYVLYSVAEGNTYAKTVFDLN